MTGAPLTYGPRTRARDENALVQSHLPLVRRLAWHVHGALSTAIEVEDLVQVGLVALVEAIALPWTRRATRRGALITTTKNRRTQCTSESP